MAVWWEPGQDEFTDRNGESPFVAKEFLEESNFQHLYKGTGEPRAVDAHELAASFTCAVNTFVQHYWTCLKDYEVTIERHVEGSGHLALEAMMPKWQEDLVEHFGIGLDPEATIKMYTSGTMVAIRRVVKICSLQADGLTVYPSDVKLPEGLDLGQVGRPSSIESTDEVGKTKRTLFRPFQFPVDIPGLDYHEFIHTNFSDWRGRRPIHFFERKPFHRALNCAICQDAPNVLKAVMKIIMDMNYFINSVHHAGGVFYSGVGIGESLRLVRDGAKLRMPRFLSTTTELKFAKSRLTDKVGPALLVVRVPHGFWGARDISAFSSCPEENETMFCAYALFEVERVSSIKLQGQEVTRIDLKALDKYEGIEYPDVSYPPFHHAEVDLDELDAHHSYVRQDS
ncbi:unnamed protein product [Effrenium voratum]|nr:unnamed protein product [Effrenium voratum]